MLRTDRSARHLIAVDLTPMIDVVLQLIIFFMLTSKFGDLRRTDIDLPRQPGEQAERSKEPAMIVDLTGDGLTLVDSRPVTVAELESLARAGLASAGEEGFDVLIRPDRNAAASQLDRVLSALAGVGVVQWKLGTFDPGSLGP
ncbi:MAG: biopolymer transporter ExbD [Planctomycetota bacterium]|nr:MAG: biopolymer transporter ExbD [Planctomycetota bacterium]